LRFEISLFKSDNLLQLIFCSVSLAVQSVRFCRGLAVPKELHSLFDRGRQAIANGRRPDVGLNLEHHLYPSIPHQNWPNLARRLDPYFARVGIKLFLSCFDRRLTLSIPRNSLPQTRFHCRVLAHFDTSPVTIGPLRERPPGEDGITIMKTVQKLEFAVSETLLSRRSIVARSLPPRLLIAMSVSAASALRILLPWKFRLDSGRNSMGQLSPVKPN